ncbi:hypothetical protein ACFYXL_10345 [Streptomyces tsukubensis]|uniref:hypothetical protein n=1 Tax=Streptomyces tsukubensis TaxID=83656 RepID=UPI0036848562
MGADYYRADSEDGDRIDDPSEDALFMMISDLNGSDNTFLDVRPDGPAPHWSATVTLVGTVGGNVYEVIRRDSARNEHEVTVSSDTDGIARELTIWTAARDRPGQAG